MRITLLRTGGIIPIKKKATATVDWTEDEINDLVKKILRENKNAGLSRDMTGYFLIYNDVTVPIDLEKVPPKYQSIFDELKDNLAPSVGD